MEDERSQTQDRTLVPKIEPTENCQPKISLKILKKIFFKRN